MPVARPIARPLATIAGLLLCLVAAPATLRAAPPADSAPPLQWPDVDVARHVIAWFNAYNTGEAAMREVYLEHYTPDALAERSIDSRIEVYKVMRGAQGALTPVAIGTVTESGIQVTARTANGQTLAMEFQCEDAAPHRIRGIQVNLGGDPGGPGGPGGSGAIRSFGGPGPGATPGRPLDDAAAVEAMRRIVTDAAAADSFSGAVLLARDGKPLLRQAWNRAERRFAVPNRPETRFNLGSVNKLFTKVAIAQLAQRGKLTLDDPLTQWLPDWPGPSAGKITIAMLAGHRAGIPDIFGPRYDAADRSKLRHNRDYLPLFRDAPLWFEPGTSERYSNGSYVLLGEIIAKASGQDYYDYLRDHVWGPAGMNATGDFEADDPTPDLAMGYTRGEDGRAPLHENVFTRPARGSAAGGGYSTLDDLLRFDQALIGGKLCPPGWTDWVIGGPPPADARIAAAAAHPQPPSVGFAGGAPGIAADYTREGAITLIVLGNFDPPLTQAVARQLRAVMRRMKP